MYVSAATEDFRRIAESVVFRRESLIPAEGKKYSWQIPFRTQLELLTPEADSCIQAFLTKKNIEIIEEAKGRGQDWRLNGLDFLMNQGNWNIRNGESIAATTLPYPLPSQLHGLATVSESRADKTSPIEGGAPHPPEQTATTKNPPDGPSVTKEAHEGKDRAIEDAVPTPKKLPELQNRKQVVYAKGVVDNNVVTLTYTLGIGDTLVLEAHEIVSAKVTGTFQLVARYGVQMLPGNVNRVGNTTDG